MEFDEKKFKEEFLQMAKASDNEELSVEEDAKVDWMQDCVDGFRKSALQSLDNMPEIVSKGNTGALLLSAVSRFTAKLLVMMENAGMFQYGISGIEFYQKGLLPVSYTIEKKMAEEEDDDNDADDNDDDHQTDDHPTDENLN